MLSHWIGVEIFIFFIPKEELNTVFLFLSPFYSAYQEKDERRADVRWVAKWLYSEEELEERRGTGQCTTAFGLTNCFTILTETWGPALQ